MGFLGEALPPLGDHALLVLQGLQVLLVGQHHQATGQQVVSGVTVLDLDHVTHVAQVFNVFLQNDFHRLSFRSGPRCDA